MGGMVDEIMIEQNLWRELMNEFKSKAHNIAFV